MLEVGNEYGIGGLTERAVTSLRDKKVQDSCSDRGWDYCCKGIRPYDDIGFDGYGIDCIPSAQAKAEREARDGHQSESQGKKNSANGDGDGATSSHNHRHVPQEKQRISHPRIPIPDSPSASPFFPKILRDYQRTRG